MSFLMSINKELFDFLSNPETFGKTIELLNSFEELKNELIFKFWQSVKKELQEKLSNDDWIIESDESPNESYYQIFIKYKSDLECTLPFAIQREGSSIVYGVFLNHESSIKIDTDKLFSQVDIFKEDGWKINKDDSSWWPIYYLVKDFSLKSNNDFRKLLPANLADCTSNLVNQIIDDFTDSVKTLIISNLSN